LNPRRFCDDYLWKCPSRAVVKSDRGHRLEISGELDGWVCTFAIIAADANEMAAEIVEATFQVAR
jgi:hypothetical protein